MTGARERVLSGMRPSGKVHLGNYLGALDNWVKLQDAYECYYFVANWHALTDDTDTTTVPGDTVEMVADWLGADQVPHVELTREVARRFNNAFTPVFPEPDAKLTEIPKVPGTDGRQMSKSYGNAIYLSDPPEVIIRKVKPMVTDPARKRRSDPGNPDVCPVFDLHKIFTPGAEREACATGCRTAGIGCLDCKDVLLRHLVPRLDRIPEGRHKFAERPDVIVDVLQEGARRARAVAQATMEEVRGAVSLTP